MKNIFDNESPDESLGFLLSRVYALRLRKVNEVLAPLGLNYVQYNLLSGLYWLQLHGENTNQMSLINFTKLDKSVVSNVTREMSKLGYIQRNECPEDTRAKILVLTPAGEAITAKAHEILNREDKVFWGHDTENKISKFFRKVIDNNP